jgi:predicted dehydrogenase
MSAWALARGLGERIEISSTWPQFSAAGPHAVIVVNAARDHEKAAEWALSAGVPVLVEKPIALTVAGSQRLADLAHRRHARFAAAHIFLFARYLDRFSRLVAEAGRIRSLRVEWTDPRSESRYGEHKRYDPSLPVFSDWLPHALSILGALAPGSPGKCEITKFLRGGAHLELCLGFGDVPCRIQLARNSDQRRRIVEVVAEQKVLQLDFSKEPGIITRDSMTLVGDPDWETKRRPAASMLAAFLRWAGGGEHDSRLDAEIGLRACRIIDQAMDEYRPVLTAWLVAKLASPGPVDDDLRYALSEMLQSSGPISANVIERRIERVRQQFSGTNGARWLDELANARNPAELLSAAAT